jgi:hypothetical protein
MTGGISFDLVRVFARASAEHHQDLRTVLDQFFKDFKLAVATKSADIRVFGWAVFCAFEDMLDNDCRQGSVFAKGRGKLFNRCRGQNGVNSNAGFRNVFLIIFTQKCRQRGRHLTLSNRLTIRTLS